MKAWKELEKEVARRLDGSRVIREDWGKRDCDIRHVVWSIECKFRADFGAWYNVELERMRELDHCIALDRSPSDFVVEALEQAHSYAPTKPALAVVKKKNMVYDDALVFMRLVDFPVDQVKHVKLINIPKNMLAFTGLKEFTQYWQKEKHRFLPAPVNYEGDG